jgi:hypothetical protein
LSYLGESIAGIPSALYEGVATPLATFGQLDDGWRESREAGSNMAMSALETPFRAYGNAAVRNMEPGPEREAAKKEAIASGLGGLTGAGGGFALGGPLGALAGALIGGVGGGEIQREVNEKQGLISDEPAAEHFKRGAANLITGGAMATAVPRIVRAGARQTAQVVTNPTMRLGRGVVERVHRLNDPNSLIASAMINSVKDTEVRPPRSVKMSGDQPYPLEAAVREFPDLTRGYVRNPNEPEFATLGKHLQQKIEADNATVNTILSKVPNLELGPSVFDKILQEATAEVPFTAKRPFVDVFYQEFGELGSNKLPETDRFRFLQLLGKHKREQQGKSRLLTPEENQELSQYFQNVINAPVSTSELRALKSRFDELGRWELGDSGEYAMRKDAFRAVANNIRNALEDAVYKVDPKLGEQYSQANRRMYLANEFQKRAREQYLRQLQKGQGFQGPPIASTPILDGVGALPIVGEFAKVFGGKMVPHLTRPEAMLRRADADPYNFGTGGQVGPVIKRGIGQGLQIGGQIGTKTLQTIDRAIGPAVIPGTVQPPVPSEEKLPVNLGNIRQWVNGMPGIISDANAQEFGALVEDAPLPRDTERLDFNSLNTFLIKTAQTPQAMIAQQLVSKMRKALQAQDMDTIEKIHSDMARIFPDYFEPGLGVNGKLFYPDEQAKYMDNLKQLQRMGQVDSIMLAKQQSAFNNPQDARILPIKPMVKGGANGKPRFYEGSRVYNY